MKFEQTIYVEYDDSEYALDVEVMLFDNEIDEVVVVNDVNNLMDVLIRDDDFVFAGMNFYVESYKIEVSIVNSDVCFDFLEENQDV